MSSVNDREFESPSNQYITNPVDENKASAYYTPSGVTPLWGSNLMAVGGILAAPVCGWISAILIVVGIVISLVSFVYCFYVIAVTAAISGMVVGRMVALGRRCGRVRHDGFSRFVAFLCATVSLYFTCHGFAWMVAGFTAQSFVELMNPSVLYPVILSGFDEWMIVFQIIALVVGILIAYCTYSGALTAVVDIPPYCEECQIWTRNIRKVCLPKIGQETDEQQYKQELESSVFKSLLRDACPETTPDRWDLTISQCPHCEQSDYLTLVVVVGATKDKDGNDISEQTRELVKHLSVPRELTTLLETMPIPARG